MVNDSQANGMGGAGKPNGAQEENTFQTNAVKQLVVLVRYKPAPAGGFDTGAASGMLSGVTGAIDNAVNAVEGAMASIPGLNLFIKEEKKDSPSEKEYTYYKDYSGWDNVLNKVKDSLKEMNDESLTDTFDFSSTDYEGRKKDAQELLQKVKSKIAGWTDYTAYIHFIGVGQGGNVANECTALLAADTEFAAQKWLVKTIAYIATPPYKNIHQLDKTALKGKGATLAFGTKYDLTQNALACFDKNEDLIKLIIDSNKNLLTLATGKVKLRVIQVLSILLSGLHLSGGDTSELKKFGKIKDEIQGLVEDMIDLVKQLIEEGTGFVKLGDIPEFSNIANGYGNIPSEAGQQFEKFLKKLTDSISQMAKSANVSLSPKDLAGVLNCLCPLFDKLADSIAIFKYNSPASEALSHQILANAKLTKVYALKTDSSTELEVDEKYVQKLDTAAKEQKPVDGAAFIKTAQSLINKASEGQADINAMNKQQKIALAEALTCLMQPMLTTKKAIYGKLLNMLPFSIEKIKEYTADKMMAIPGGLLEKLNIDFPDELKASIARLDKEIGRVKSFFDKKEFGTEDDTLYFIFNQHNLVLKKMYGPVANYIDQQTGYAQYMASRGYVNTVTLQENKYAEGKDEPKENVMPAKELPVEA